MGFGEYEQLYSVMAMFLTMFGNVLMLNYLVAILSKTYESMLEIGSFLYKVKKFQYCQRYQVAFDEENAPYTQLVIHPAPMCFLNLPILLLSLLPLPEPAFLAINHYFSLALFWLENVVYVVLFAAFEVLLIPFVYIKMLFVIPWATLGLFTSIFYTAFWFASGLAILIWIALNDLGNFLRILAMHDGCRVDTNDDDSADNGEEDIRIRIMNSVRIEVIKLYEEIKKDKLGLEFSHEQEEKEKNRNYEEENVIELLENDAHLFESDNEADETPDPNSQGEGNERRKRVKLERSDFIIKMTTIHDNWRKMKGQDATKKKSKEGPDPDQANKQEDTTLTGKVLSHIL
jgi:hypothetical protein